MPLSPQFSAICLKGYRELLRKLRQDRAVDEAASPAVLQRAKERVFHSVTSRRRKDSVDLHRAFSRLYDRLAQARSELKLLKDEKKEKWLAKYAAVRSQLGGQAEPSYAGDALLGQNGLLRALVVAGVGGAAKLFMAGATRTRVAGAEVLEAALARPPGQALITVSNHVAAADDPFILAAALPVRALGNPQALRWTLCATDRCFKHAALGAFFRAGKVLPVERGAGLEQAGMRAAEGRLAAGDWVHVFPEGTRSRDGLMGPMRKGIGRLVASAPQPPLVVPLVHSGMERVLAPGAKLPRPGQAVDILVGPPIAVEDLITAAKVRGWSDDHLYRAITQRIGAALYSLKAHLDGVPELAVVRGGVPTLDPSAALIPLIQDELDCAACPWPKRAAPLRAGAVPLEQQFGGGALPSLVGTLESAFISLEQALNSPWQPCMRMLCGRGVGSGADAGATHLLAGALETATAYSALRTQRMMRLAGMSQPCTENVPAAGLRYPVGQS